MGSGSMDFIRQVEAFVPGCVQEEADQKEMLSCIRRFPDAVLYRENRLFHMTASAMVFDETMERTLLVHHLLFDAWTWVGGHTDGMENLLRAAEKEAREETGVEKLLPVSEEILSLDILPVFGHWKNGAYVPAHLHFSAAYGFVCDAEKERLLHSKEGENSGVMWASVKEIGAYAKEAHMRPIYSKIIERARARKKR